MSALRGKFARLAAALVLIAGLAGVSMPGFATAPDQAKPIQAAAAMAGMDCAGASHAPTRHPAPQPHAPGSDCCMVNLCAMGQALLAAPSGLAPPATLAMPRYDLRALTQSFGIVAAPIPHPPKSRA